MERKEERPRVAALQEAAGIEADLVYGDFTADPMAPSRASSLNGLPRSAAAPPEACCSGILAATNQDIAESVRTGQFRDDLYYRLNVVGLNLPDLSERREDIPLLIDHFLKRYAEKDTQPPPRFSNEAMRLMIGSAWPGNVRELQNAVEHALAISSGPILKISDLPAHISGVPGSAGQGELVNDARSLREVQRRHILRILEDSGGNHVRAAEILGIDRRTLYRQLDKYRLPAPIRPAVHGGAVQ